MLKPRSNESAEHFLVIRVIEEYLQKYTKNIKLLVSSNADIIFEAHDKKVAIEVETGSKFDHDQKQLETKVRLLKKNFGTRWFFVVTDARNYKRKYSTLGTTYSRKEVPAIIKKCFDSVISNFEDIEPGMPKNGGLCVQISPLLSPDSIEPLNHGGTNGN